MVRENTFTFEIEDYTYDLETEMASTPITQTVEIYAGDTPKFTFNFKKKGSAYNLADTNVTFSAKSSTSATSFLFEETCTVETPVRAGKATVNFPYLNNDNEGSYVAEVKIIDSGDGLTTTVTQFNLDINLAITE